MNIDQVMHTFIAESRELLEQMENALLAVAHDGPDAVNAIFRAAHTIKGSAGMFGLDPVVDFTHVAESVLDKVRDGHVPVTDELVALLLACCDHIGALVDAVESGTLDTTRPCSKPAAAGRRAAGLPGRHRAPAAGSTAAAAAPRPSRQPACRNGTSRCASARTCCATAWIRCPSSATSPSWAASRASTARRPPAGRRRIRSGILLPRLRDRLRQQRKPGHHRRRVRLRARRLRDPHRAGTPEPAPAGSVPAQAPAPVRQRQAEGSQAAAGKAHGPRRRRQAGPPDRPRG
jgi:chemotaxis protein histidine kinase CheA